jgi:hypothetical protein
MGQLCSTSSIFLTGIYIPARNMPAGMQNGIIPSNRLIIMYLRSLLGSRDGFRGVKNHVGFGTTDDNIFVDDHFSDVFHGWQVLHGVQQDLLQDGA